VDHPDFTSRAARKAYRHERRMAAVRARRLGLWLLALGALLLMLPWAFGAHSLFGWSPRVLGLFACLAALPLLLAAIFLRARYHRGRMRGRAPPHRLPD
jgi:hypothetical protein